MFKQQVVRSFVCVLLAMAFFIVGCGGHAANPVDRYMPGDEKKSCASLMSEITMTDQEVVQKQQKIKDRNFWNTIEFVAGFVVIVPWFFMDTKGSYEVEVDALKARQKMLKGYFAENGCNVADLADATAK